MTSDRVNPLLLAFDGIADLALFGASCWFAWMLLQQMRHSERTVLLVVLQRWVAGTFAAFIFWSGLTHFFNFLLLWWSHGIVDATVHLVAATIGLISATGYYAYVRRLAAMWEKMKRL